jgi:DNA-directed RNA polymerase subunit M/transcription elongation factor TFIIS
MQNLQNKTVSELKNYFDNDTVKDIEASIKDFSFKYSEINNAPFLLESIYKNKYSELLNEISKKTYLYKSIMDKSIDIKNIAYLKAEELNPEKYESIIKLKELEEHNKINNVGSTIFKCKMCKKSNCKITQKQMRSGDEPPTTFATCLECNHVSKYN